MGDGKTRSEVSLPVSCLGYGIQALSTLNKKNNYIF